MPSKKRDYKHEYQLQKARGELPDRMERQRARRKLDKEGVDRTGKHIHHVKALANGGSNATGTKLVSPHDNLSFARTPTGKPKQRKK